MEDTIFKLRAWWRGLWIVRIRTIPGYTAWMYRIWRAK